MDYNLSVKQPCGSEGILFFKKREECLKFDKNMAVVIVCERCPYRVTSETYCEDWDLWMTWYQGIAYPKGKREKLPGFKVGESE